MWMVASPKMNTLLLYKKLLIISYSDYLYLKCHFFWKVSYFAWSQELHPSGHLKTITDKVLQRQRVLAEIFRSCCKEIVTLVKHVLHVWFHLKIFSLLGKKCRFRTQPCLLSHFQHLQELSELQKQHTQEKESCVAIPRDDQEVVQ